jgi:hypothetical protein
MTNETAVGGDALSTLNTRDECRPGNRDERPLVGDDRRVHPNDFPVRRVDVRSPHKFYPGISSELEAPDQLEIGFLFCGFALMVTRSGRGPAQPSA